MDTNRRNLSYEVRFIVDRHNVADSYEAVASDIADRIARYNDSATPTARGRLITDSVIIHAHNRKLYNNVMG